MKQFLKRQVILSIILMTVLLSGCMSFVPYESGNKNYSAHEQVFIKFNNQKERDPELEALFDTAIEQYGASGKFIIDHMKEIANSYCSSPYIAYYNWISDYTRKKKGRNDFMFSLVSDVDSSIHETAHQFSSTAAYINSEYTTSIQGYLSYSAPSRITSVYLEDWGVQHILQTPTVPAKVISDLIQNKEIMKDNRYITYINSESPYQSTQTEGIYGLLDEYHAYYYSVIASANKALDTTLDSSFKENGKTYYLSPFTDIYLSYLQFSTYILTYYRAVELNYPQVYKDIIENELLLEAIIRIHDAFQIEYNRFLEIMYSESNKFTNDTYKDEHKWLKAEYELPENQQILVTIRRMLESSRSD